MGERTLSNRSQPDHRWTSGDFSPGFWSACPSTSPRGPRPLRAEFSNYGFLIREQARVIKPGVVAITISCCLRQAMRRRHHRLKDFRGASSGRIRRRGSSSIRGDDLEDPVAQRTKALGTPAQDDPGTRRCRVKGIADFLRDEDAGREPGTYLAPDTFPVEAVAAVHASPVWASTSGVIDEGS